MTKEEIKYINSLEKSYVYEDYQIINVNKTPYDKITKRKMIEEIYLSIKESDKYLKSVVLKKDLLLLIDAINNGLTTIKITPENKLSAYRLGTAHLLFFPDQFEEENFIPSDVLEILKDYDLSNYDDLLDDFYYFVNGLLLTRGKIKIKEAKEIYEMIKPKDFNLSFNKNLEFIVRKLRLINLNEFYKNKLLISKIVNKYFFVNEDYPKPYYSFETYLSFGKYGIDINTNEGAKIYNIISNESKNKYPYFQFFKLAMHHSLSDEFISREILEILFQGNDDDIDKAISMYNDLTMIMPRWDFFGELQKNIKLENIPNFNIEIINSVIPDDEMCSCGSGLLKEECCENEELLLSNKAILEESKAHLFYSLLNTLILSANYSHDLFEMSNPDTFLENLSQENFMKLKDLVFEDPEILDDFVAFNKNSFNDDAWEMIKGFKNSYKSIFIGFEYKNQKLICYDEPKKIRLELSGITSPFSDNISFDELPVFFETRIIPLNDRIIYDVTIQKMQVGFGPGIRKKLAKDIIGTKLIRNINDLMLKPVKSENIIKTIDRKTFELIKVTEDTIDDYTTIWLEVLQSMKGVRGFNHAREILKEFKETFISFNDSSTALDFHPIVRVLKVDGNVVGFLNGILSYFESGIMFQIGNFGISSRYRKKGYGKIFIELLKEDMKNYNANYLWLLPQNDGFWLKQDFISNQGLMKSLYSLSVTDKALTFKISDEKISFESFLKMFYKQNGKDIPYVRSERSYK